MVKPNLIGSYGDFNLFEHEGAYYAVSDVNNADSILEKINEKTAIVAKTQEELEKIIDNTSQWANSRGLYGLEQKSGDQILRVNSFNVIDENDIKIDNPTIIIENSQTYLVNEREYKKVSQSKGSNTKENQWNFVNSFSVGAVPELIFEYKKYNIVELDKIYYGINQGLGAVDLMKVPPQTLKGVFSGDTIKDVMNKIDIVVPKNKANEDQFVIPGANKSEKIETIPKLLSEYEKYNIVEFNKIYYGIKQSLGTVDLMKTPPETLKEVLSGQTEKDVKNKIDALFKKNKSTKEDIFVPEIDNIEKKAIEIKNKGQKLIEAYLGYNIFFYEKTFFAIPIEGPKVDLEIDDYFENPSILYDVSIGGLKEAINASEGEKKSGPTVE